MLLGAHRRAKQRDRRLVLRDARPGVLRILRATRLHRVLTLEPAPPPSRLSRPVTAGSWPGQVTGR